MSVKVITWVWDHSRAKKTDRLVLLAIADCAHDDGANAYPSMTELMRKTGLSERGVQTALKRLMTLGELFVSQNGGPRGCNRYRVIMADPTPQGLHPADYAAPPQVLRDTLPDSSQVWNVTPADSAPRTDGTPQETAPTPAAAAPGTVLEPSRNSSSKSSKTTGPRGTRLPADFHATAEMVAWAREHTPNVGAAETEAFIDYWRGISGQRGTKLDWPATWRNWMRKAQSDHERRAGRAPTGHRPYRNPTDPSAYLGDL